MQVPTCRERWSESNNAGPGSYILGPELMLEGKETLLEENKASSIMLEFNFIF